MNPNSVLAELYTLPCRHCTPPQPPQRSLWRDKGTWFEPKLHVLVGLLRVILHASVGADWWRKHLSKKQEEMSDIKSKLNRTYMKKKNKIWSLQLSIFHNETQWHLPKTFSLRQKRIRTIEGGSKTGRAKSIKKISQL